MREAGYFLEVMSTALLAESDKENGFGMNRLGFPTERRPVIYWRELKMELSTDFEGWLKLYPGLIGS